MIEEHLNRPAWWLHDHLPPWRWMIHWLGGLSGDGCFCDQQRT